LANKYEILKRLEDVESKCATLVTNWWGNHEKKIASYPPNIEGGGETLNQTSNQAMIHRSKWVRWNQLGLP
jgi:hypothetical protein